MRLHALSILSSLSRFRVRVTSTRGRQLYCKELTSVSHLSIRFQLSHIRDATSIIVVNPSQS